MDNPLAPADTETHVSEISGRFLSQLGPLLILTSIFFLNFVSRITLAPLIPEIEINFNLTHAEAGTLFFLISLGNFITLTGSGFISSRLNHKRTIIVSNTALGLALIAIAFCKDIWTLRLALFMLGLTTGVYLPSGISTLTGLINSRHWGKALAIHDIAPNLSIVAAPLIAEAIMARYSWRIVFILFGLAALVMSPLFARLGRGGESFGQAPSFSALRELFIKSSYWVMILFFSLGICATLGIYTMLPLYLVTEHAIDRNLANTLIALSRLSGLIMVFVGGWAVDRFGPRSTLKIIFLISGVMTVLLGAVPRSYIPLIVFLQPLVAVCFFPVGFAALSFIVPPKSRNIAVSLTVPLASVVGGGLVPIFIGVIGDISSFAIGIAICGGLITAGALFTGILKFHGQEI
ncbi:MAG: MFS transporter [Desulfobacterales bacterium]|jgi:NNP family nitrate/nitrite transporter-like MFS transporter